MINDCVILAGGAGTRLWPASTFSKPKQFLRRPYGIAVGRMPTKTAVQYKHSGVSANTPQAAGCLDSYDACHAVARA